MEKGGDAEVVCVNIMTIQNITGLEKPLEKLIEVVSEGLGVVANEFFKFDAKKIKRIGEAEAEIEKTKIVKKAEGNIGAIERFKRAEKRFALEQYNKQINLENIIVGAKEKLIGSEVSDQPVDKDWAFRFMNIAQDVSRDDMQKLLSKILADEIKRPGTFSLRTLDFVKNLSKDDLLSFKKFAILTSQDSIIHITKNDANEGFSSILYSEIMGMIETGFIQASITTVLKLKDIEANKIYPILFKGGNYYIFKFTEKQSSVNIPILQLTVFGKEIASLLDIEEGDKGIFQKYVEDLKEFLKTKKIEFVNNLNHI